MPSTTDASKSLMLVRTWICASGACIWWKSRFSRCHCSLEISSRTWPAFSRAPFTQKVTLAGLRLSNISLLAIASRSPFHSMPTGLPSEAIMRCQRVSALVSLVSSIRLMVTSSWRTVFSARSR